jgi:hypothetical protein
MFNLIEELFSPGRKHADDEKRRLEHTRVEEGSTDPGKGPIDLSSGHVLIRPPAPRVAPGQEPGQDPASVPGPGSGPAGTERDAGTDRGAGMGKDKDKD